MFVPIVPNRCIRGWRPLEGALDVNPYRGALGCTRHRKEQQVPIRTFFTFALAPLAIVALLGLSVSAAEAFPPANDYFVYATAINPGALPFSDTVDMTEASIESGEPEVCAFSYQTVWYKFTPSSGAWFSTNMQGTSLFGSLVVYRDTGGGFFGLSFIGCSSFSSSGSVLFLGQAGTTYYVQALSPCCFVSGSMRVNLAQVPPPVPLASFSYYPGDPSAFDAIQFGDQSIDPGQVGIGSRAWDFGDGTRDSSCCPTHHYTADGNYTVQLTVTTYDGRIGSTSRVVTVRTHDVAITKFKVPNSASSGQSRLISVGIRNTRYPETVHLELYKSVPSSYYGYQLIGSLDQFVPVRSSNRTTDFNFSYTFTGEDARIGKVTFRALATLLSARDALAADNEAISSPVKVGGSTSGGGPDTVFAGDAKLKVVTGTWPARPGTELALLRVAPNPANPGADLLVQLSVPTTEPARLQVLDLAGRVVTDRDLGSLAQGIHEVRVAWDRRPAPGNYWMRLTQGGKSVSTKVGIVH